MEISRWLFHTNTMKMKYLGIFVDSSENIYETDYLAERSNNWKTFVTQKTGVIKCTA